MELIVNGEQRVLEAATIHDVIRHFGLEGKPVAVEADGEVVPKGDWPVTPVHAGMRIELVHFVGGG
ncbi:sulfur carrier protein ThiS [Paenibacillus alkalitolerans]|uniref:sulfur carrier protein ThiS n=1 Tax=Paenibacillus alkalitolerans TaxID=2799335 RepID=UPI0018F343F1|nr:sulfur carrier protein ThiS [Paenibacillus alkalitolerans]